MRGLDLALQGYDELANAMTAGLTIANSDKAEAWLREEVCPVYEDLATHRSFQLAARWSVDHLEPGVHTKERSLVEATDAAIVRLAAELAWASSQNAAQFSAGDANARNNDDPSVGRRQTLEWIASRPWYDLVSPEEYFHAYRGLNLKASNLDHTKAFQEYRELRVPLGDYVARSMFARIDYWKKLLDKAGSNTLAKCATDEEIGGRLIVARSDFDVSLDKLSSEWLSPRGAHLCDAASALTQVYVAYSRSPQVDWLGCPELVKSAPPDICGVIRRKGEAATIEKDLSGRIRVRTVIEGSFCDPSVLRHIASALRQVQAFCEAPEDPDDLVEWTKDRTQLLLVDRAPRQVFWEGKAAGDNAWDNAQNEWNLLWVLSKNVNRSVDQGLLRKPEGEHIRSRRNRLSKLLEGAGNDLDLAIETVRGLGYRLNLDAQNVVLLRDDGFGKLVED